MGSGLVIGFIEFLQLEESIALALFPTLCNSIQFSVSCVFTSPLIMHSSGGRFPSSEFPNCPHASAIASLK
jgi:hypothetical protein